MPDPDQALPLAERLVQIANTYGPLLTMGAILVSAILGATVAVISIIEQRKIARKRATLDLVAQKEWDEDYIKAKNEFNKQRDADNDLTMWLEKDHQNSDQLNSIRSVLNDYELIAVGIREGILDEELYRRWFRTSFLKDYRASKRFIKGIRSKEDSEKIFAEFEWLALKWDPDLAQGEPPPEPEAAEEGQTGDQV